LKALGVVGTLLLLASLASASVISASGEGWCNDSGCDNTSTSALANTFAGSYLGNLYQVWFAFALPSTPISTATISIWNDGRDYNTDASAVFNLYAASSISYGGLVSGPSLGSVSVNIADTGITQYVNITLNGASVAALNANLGTTFVFGGQGGTNSEPESQLFGYTGGYPEAYLTTSNVPETGTLTNVPEPGTLTLFGSGLLGAVGVIRRKINL